jgi:hypothetical protein
MSRRPQYLVVVLCPLSVHFAPLPRLGRVYVIENNGRHERIRTADLYRVKVAL